MRNKCLITLLNVVFFLSSFLNAAEIISVQSGDWTNSSTWKSGVIPTKNDNVTIAKEHTVTYDQKDSSEKGNFTVELCNDLVVNGVLEASSTVNRNFILNIGGSIVCNGAIKPLLESKQGAIIKFDKAKSPTITGKGSIEAKIINLNVLPNSDCIIDIPMISLTDGLYLTSYKSTVNINSETTINIAENGLLSLASNGGQGRWSNMNIYGVVNVGTVLLCNNEQKDTNKSTLTIKRKGALNVSKEFAPIRRSANVAGTIGGTGFILSVEKGGELSWSQSVEDPKNWTNAANAPNYDPNLEIYLNK